ARVATLSPTDPMAVKLPDGLAADQIRILQEFRRRKVRTLTVDEIAAIRHPVGGGPEAVEALIEKGYLRRRSDQAIEVEPKGEALAGVEALPHYERG
ncbi:MAG TPA: hypothetical protein VLV48_09585, partial [Thermoanaerobaculia bacterium]|nr:hypothetical protein [Thermoanaerobaculia bacterium]